MPSPLELLADKDFDALVLGGGLTGAATARELSTRGARVALIEPVDFGWGGSGRGARLAVGAFPVSPWANPRLTRALLQERSLLARSARHLARLVPILSTRVSPIGWNARASMAKENLLARLFRSRGWPPSRTVTTRQLKTLLPGFDTPPAQASRIFFDAQFEDRRLALLTALEARRCGAVLASRCDVLSLESAQPGFAWVEIRDRLTGETVCLRIRALINATGPWIDRTRRFFDVTPQNPLFETRRAVRLVIPHPIEAGLLLRHPEDNRPVLVAPAWGGLVVSALPNLSKRNHSDQTAPEDPSYLEPLLAGLFSINLPPPRVQFTATRVAATRPGLVREKHAGIPFWSVVSGTPLLNRLTAKSAAQRLASELGPFSARRPRSLGYLPGGDIAGLAGEEAAARADRFSPLQARWLVSRYGSLWREVVDRPEAREPIGPGEIPLRGEIAWAVHQEEARTLSCLLLRWRLPEIAANRADERSIAAAAAAELAQCLDWPLSRREREATRWEKERAQAYSGPHDDAEDGL